MIAGAVAERGEPCAGPLSRLQGTTRVRSRWSVI
jgi:hypothetical protein